MNLSRFAKLKSNHIWRDSDPSHITKSILGKQSPTVCFERNLVPLCVDVHRRSKSSKGSVVIMPPAPVILGIALGIEGEVIEHSSSVHMSCGDDSREAICFIGGNVGLRVLIDLLGDHCAD